MVRILRWIDDGPAGSVLHADCRLLTYLRSVLRFPKRRYRRDANAAPNLDERYPLEGLRCDFEWKTLFVAWHREASRHPGNLDTRFPVRARTRPICLQLGLIEE